MGYLNVPHYSVTKMKNTKAKVAIQTVLWLLPFLLVIIAVFCLSSWLFNTVIFESTYYKLVTNTKVINNDLKIELSKKIDEVSEEVQEFPNIPYLSQWATLNVEGWEQKDIPVYSGDNADILEIGSGHYIGSPFCGQGGRVVLTAHVTEIFYELEDMKKGDIVTVDTIYGRYKYKVIETTVFDYQDTTYISKYDRNATETLFMYTCYPRSQYGIRYRRYGVLCEKIDGKDWHTNEKTQ